MINISAVENRKVWFGLSGILVSASLILMLLSYIQLGSPIRMGLDFTGGTKLEYKFTAEKIDNLNSEAIQTILKSVDLNNSTATVTEEAQPVLILRTKAISDDPALDRLNTKLTKQYGEFEIMSIDTVSPVIGPELLRNGLIALAFTVLGIIFYISNRFKRDYAMCAITALFHDVIIVMGVFAALGIFAGIEVNTLFITAILTVFGFSVHDTIVVFDRVRENQKLESKSFGFVKLADHSVNQVATRSLNTSITTLTVLGFLYFFGGTSTQLFVGALFIGMFVGTYSSLFLASPLLAELRNK